MKKLEKEIHTNGHVYKQVKRTEGKAIYAQYTKDGQLAGHEVFFVKIAPPTSLFGKEYPEREVYPSTAEFGKIAYSVGISLKRALKRFDEL